MRCGKCKQTGVNIDHVKSCYGVEDSAPPESLTAQWRAQQNTDAEISANTAIENVNNSWSNRPDPLWPASEKQIAYALGLQDERILPDDWTIYTEFMLKHMERDEVSSKITMLKSFPVGSSNKAGNLSTLAQNVPAGRYALRLQEHRDEIDPMTGRAVNADISTGYYTTVVRFYQVDKPTEGRWKGYTFVKQLFGAPGDFRKESLTKGAANDVLKLIAKDPDAAMTLFGKELGICGSCGSPLTNEESRARGIGPICLGKLGW